MRLVAVATRHATQGEPGLSWAPSRTAATRPSPPAELGVAQSLTTAPSVAHQFYIGSTPLLICDWKKDQTCNHNEGV